jgi:hypothetical protein
LNNLCSAKGSRSNEAIYKVLLNNILKFLFDYLSDQNDENFNFEERFKNFNKENDKDFINEIIDK